MDKNDSYDLAEAYVVEQIDGLTHTNTPAGSWISVGDMQTCDCIPTLVIDPRRRLWRLIQVNFSCGVISAVYEC